MDKKILKTVLSGLQAGQEINVSFRAPQTALSGAFRVLESKVWRGKGGSRIAKLQALSGDMNTVTIGTPDNFNSKDYCQVLNMTINGVQYGAASEADEPRVYETSESKAVTLKEQMRPLLGDAGVGRQVRISSAIEPKFNGLFTVNRAKLEKGRYGQIHLFLTGENGQSFELWTYRHSIVIDSFEIVEVPAQSA